MDAIELLPMPGDYVPSVDVVPGPSLFPLAALVVVLLFLVVLLLLRISIQIRSSPMFKEFQTLQSLIPAACAALKAKDAQIADLKVQLATAEADAVAPADAQALIDQLAAAGITPPPPPA